MLDLKGYGHLLIDGAWMTIGAGLVSLAVAILLGLVAAAAKVSRSRLARLVADTYTTVIRGVPELVLLLLVFFGGTILLQKLFQLFGNDGYVEVNAFFAGVGTIVLIDAAIQPCRGFHALLGMNEHECVDGVYVGDAPRRVSSVHSRRVIR